MIHVKSRTPCWFCDRQLRNNKGVRVKVDGHLRYAHAVCAKFPDLIVPESVIKQMREKYEPRS